MTIFKRTYGTGPRQALALHCSLAHCGAWRGVGLRLGEDVTLTALDFPAHGRSDDCPVGTFPERSHRAAREALMAFDGPVDLIGHSWGGVIAMSLAIAHPDLVRSLSLYEPILTAACPDPDLFLVEGDHMDAVEAHVGRGEHDMAARLFMRVWGDGRPWANLPVEARATFARGIAHVITCQPALRDDVLGLLESGGIDTINTPTVVINGGASPKLAHSVQDAIAARIQRAQRVTIDRAGHMGPITHAADVAAAITNNFTRS